MTAWLIDTMLHEKRKFYIDNVKKPIMKILIRLMQKYVEPTEENLLHPNSKVMLRVWKKFQAMEDNPGREPLFESVKRVHIGEHDHDNYYRDRQNVWLELWLEEVLAGHWKPRSLDHPHMCWKADPNDRGIGFELMQDKYYHAGRKGLW